MRPASPSTARLTLAVIFAAGLALLGVATVLAYMSLHRLSAANWWVVYTQDVRAELIQVLSALQGAETGQRGFIITGEREYLKPYRTARHVVPARLAHLESLTADNPAQQRLLRELEETVNVKMSELRLTIALRKRAGLKAAQDIVGVGRGKRAMDQLHDIIANMARNEDVLLAERVREVQIASLSARFTFGLTAILALGGFTIIYMLARRQLRYATEREALLATADRARREAEMAAVAEHEARTVAEAASSAKDAFLATVSHELRTPVSPILAWVRMLRHGNVESEKATRALEVIERSARAQAQLVEDLLDVSRIVAGKMRLEVRPVALSGVIEKAVDIIRPAAEAKNVRLQLVLDTEVGPALGDAERLQQVVWNLLSNAVKFTPKGGRVQIALERVNSHVEIAVSDTGQGIDPAFLPHVFEGFQQAQVGTTRVHSGLGLGLAIVRHIVEAHGGTVHAESPGTGKGAVFTVKLPLMMARRAGEVERRHPTAVAASDGHELPRLHQLRLWSSMTSPSQTRSCRRPFHRAERRCG